MIYFIILSIIVLMGLIIGTITDLKTREVPDWLSYGLISIGLGINLIFSIIYWDYWFFANSIIGFLLFLMIALIMFYTGQWGGGDSKVLMSLGALIGLDVRFLRFPLLVNLFINIVLIGAIYGLAWSFILILKNHKSFLKEFKKTSRNDKMIKIRKYLFILIIPILILALLFRETMPSFILISFATFSLIVFYLYISIKVVEKTCMIKTITPDKLTEGDWIVKEIKYQGRYICGPKDLGIEKRRIRELIRLYKQNKIKRVLIKEGIPFVPSFLIAYILTLLYGNLLFTLIAL